jgi:hypothetical protein
MPQFPIYSVLSKTATDDNVFQVTTLDIWMKEADIFVYTNDADCGTVSNQDIWINANDIYTPKGIINVGELYFKNHTGGSNTTVVIAGVRMSDDELRKAGLSV